MNYKYLLPPLLLKRFVNIATDDILIHLYRSYAIYNVKLRFNLTYSFGFCVFFVTLSIISFVVFTVHSTGVVSV